MSAGEGKLQLKRFSQKYNAISPDRLKGKIRAKWVGQSGKIMRTRKWF